MIGYVEPPVFTFGSYSIHAFGLLAFTAILVGVGLVVARAPKIGLSRDDALNLVVWTVAAGLVGSHVFSEIAYYPQRVLEDPLELLRIWGTMSSFGGILGGILGAWATMRLLGTPPADRWRFLDAVAFAFPFSWIFGRAGCALAHDHIGIESAHWLAVRFPGGSRFDLGLLELLYTIPIAGLFWMLDRRKRPTGFYLGLFFTLYGPGRFAMDSLRVEEARYFGWTPSQYLCVVTTFAGIAILVRIVRRREVH